MHCVWKFSTISRNHIEVKLKNLNFGIITNSFGVRCFYSDYLKVFQRQVIAHEWQELKKICEMNQTNEVIVGSNSVKLEFSSNTYMNGTGFEAVVYEGKESFLLNGTERVFFHLYTLEFDVIYISNLKT